MPAGLPIKVVSSDPSARDLQDRLDDLAGQLLEIPGARPAGWREGHRLSVWRRKRWLTLHISWDDVAELGPAVHAMASAGDLSLLLPNIEWTIEPHGDDFRLWDAIQRGADDSSDEILTVGHGMFDPFRYIHVTAVDGTPTLTVDEAAFSPRVRQPRAYATGTYDNWDWHAAGDRFSNVDDPAEAFVHIGMYLTWAISNDLMATEYFDPPTVAEVKARHVLGTELRHDVDGQLLPEMFGEAGRGFSDWYYAVPEAMYLNDWVETFGEAANEYAVPATWETYDLIAPVIDRRFAEWLSTSASASERFDQSTVERERPGHAST
jgi:hypothetical protein